MGFGDVTLLAMIGAFLGWQAAVVVFFLAPVAGSGRWPGPLLLRGENEIPYGPFLCLAAAATVLAWPAIWDFCYRVFLSGLEADRGPGRLPRPDGRAPAAGPLDPRAISGETLTTPAGADKSRRTA